MSTAEEKIMSDYADDWQELTQAEVITDAERAEFNAYCQAGEAERVRATFVAWVKDCGRELDRLTAYVNTPNDAPTYAQVGDLYAVYEKLVNINLGLGLYQDAGEKL